MTTTPSVPPGSPDLDLTAANSAGSLGDAVFQSGSSQQEQSTQFNTIVRLQSNGIEQGYNTDSSIEQYNEKDGHHHSLLLANIPIVIGDGTNGTIEGIAYRQFVLNINDPSGAKRYLSLDELQIWQGESGGLTGFTPDAGFAGLHTNYLAYDLDAGDDRWIGLADNASGTPQSSEYSILIPDSYFINDTDHRYVTLYSSFGVQGGWQADGGFEEWGTATGATPPGTTAAINADKTASVDGGTADQAGEVITYSIRIYNVGDKTLTGITVSDPTVSNLTRGADISGDNDDLLEAGETWSYSAQHVVTQAEINANGNGSGVIANTVTVDSNETGPVTASAAVVVEQSLGLELTKTGTVLDGTADAAGDQITYSLGLTNTGTTTQSGPQVTDPMNTTVTPVEEAVLIEDPNVQFFAPIFDGDFNLGDTNQNGVWDASETYQFAYRGDFDFNGVHDAGETWTAINLGDANNDGIHQVGEVWAGDANQDGVEDAGERWLFKNQGDTNGNHLQDSGEVWEYVNVGDDNHDGVEDPGENWSFANAGDTNQNGLEDPGETFQVGFFNVGDTNQNGVEDSGETFQFVVDTSVPGVDADNNGFNDGDANANGLLDVGETWQFAFTHTLTQDEIDNGGVVDPGLALFNTATGATDQDSTTASASVSVVQNPDLTIVKTADVSSVDAAGDVINYTVAVDNVGNMTLTGPSVTDGFVSNLAYVSGDADSDGKLDVDETWLYAGSHSVTQDEIDNGGVVDPALTIDNTATADTGQTDPESASASVLVLQNPDLAIVKSADVSSVDAAGDVINYTVSVDNIGNMTLTGLTVTDPFVGLAYASGDADNDGKLDVDETWLYAGIHTVTQAEIDNGGVVDPALAINNTATADTDQTAPESASASVEVIQNPDLTITKSADVASVDGAGDVITYTVTVDNTGNMTLTNVVVADPSVTLALTGGDTDNDGQLDLDETWTYGGSRTVSQAEMDAGVSIDNTASVDTDQTAVESDGASVAVVQTVGITLDKTGALVDADADGFADAGETVHYAFTVTNNGNVTLDTVLLNDSVLGGAVAGPDSGDTDSDSLLDVGETWLYSADHTLTQAEINAGTLSNTATVTAAGPQDQPASASDSASVTLPQAPVMAVTLDKSDVNGTHYVDSNEDGNADAGELIQYIIVLKNLGTVAIHNVVLTDTLLGGPLGGPDGGDANNILDPGETWLWDRNYVVTSADAITLNNGDAIHNEATATGLDPANAPVTLTAVWDQYFPL